MISSSLSPYVQAKLQKMQAQLDLMRQLNGVSDRGATLTRFEYDDEEIIALADGFGEATVKWLEAIGDDEVPVHRFHHFDTEKDAYDAVEWLRVKLANAEISRSEFFTVLGEGKRPFKPGDPAYSPAVLKE